MTRYELQHHIFIKTMDLYPSLQHDQVYKHLEKVWQLTDVKLNKYLDTLNEIIGE
jgi:hypothetical protein